MYKKVAELLDVPEDERLFTPATAMSLSRPALLAKASQLLLKGERYVTPLVGAAGLSDTDGKVARRIDRWFPGRGWGVTETGAKIDKGLDAMAITMFAGTLLVSPGVSRPAKIATALMLGEEASKIAEMVRRNREYSATTGKMLDLEVVGAGQEATAAKFTGLFAAAATNDLDPGRARTAAGMLSLALAGGGIYLGRQARDEYTVAYEALMADAI